MLQLFVLGLPGSVRLIKKPVFEYVLKRVSFVFF